MSYTVQSVIDDANDIYAEMPEATALKFLNSVRRTVLAKIPLMQSANTLSTTADEPVYTYSASITRIQDVEYATSATDSRRLIPISKDTLNETIYNWRRRESGTPTHYCLESDNTGIAQIRMFPAPDTTTSGSYPQIRVYAEITSALLIGDTIYDDLDSTEVYVTGIAKMWARTKRPDDLALRTADHERCLSQLNRYFMGKGKEVSNVTLSPNWLGSGPGWGWR